MKSIYRAYSDLELTGLMAADDKAFAEVYDRYFGVIYAFVRKMLQDDDQAEDLTQEIFLSLYENRTSSGITSLRAYLYQSARYALIDHSRRQQSRYTYMAGLKDYIAKGEWSTDELVIQRDLERQIDRGIQNLPEKMRAIFELSRKHYLSNKEIAAALTLSEGTVRQQIHNAIVRLRASISCLVALLFMLSILWANKFLDRIL
ncbi:RNA polymerase sigma factor [Sphingobacterium faecale]|uniref:RNA polymerase sigma-70 factor n=1 Tax=Sphingobacterium faecale TaxID=2803775 RepID=A0ABS1R4S7_9SPHI|nr:RNA polymerase sigma-70 factor [Sphingobacterium faecale]MBL1409012.1 RNA polymerase sigma-70 factor [Sphingobacterium faecale]